MTTRKTGNTPAQRPSLQAGAAMESARELLAPAGSHLHHNHHGIGTCGCFIVPKKVLERFANDNKLSAQQRKYFADAATLEDDWRKARAEAANLVSKRRELLPTGMTAASIAAAAPPAVLIFDGIFLNRPELRDEWDLSIFLDVPFEVSFARMAKRDGSDPNPEAPGNKRDLEGQKLYFKEVRPQRSADVVIDYADWDLPRVVRG